jgi:hypothetical protein
MAAAKPGYIEDPFYRSECLSSLPLETPLTEEVLL